MQKKIYALAAIAVILGGLAVFWVNQDKAGPPKSMTPETLPEFVHNTDIFITPEQLHQKLGSENLVILDASHPKGYAKDHIPGAVSIGFKGLSDCTGKPGDPEWGTVLPKEKLTQKLKSLGIGNDSLVVAYSDIFKGPGGGGRAVWQLRMAGFKNAKLLYGGLARWKARGYELSDTPVSPVPAQELTLFDYDESYRAPKAYIQEHLGRTKLVDVRSLKEYTGDDTSRGEARGGHIQDARWLEWKDLLTKDAGVKSAPEIKQLMADIGIRPEDDFVLY